MHYRSSDAPEHALTKKPRITVTLEPLHHEVLSRLARASGESMSQIVAQFVEMAIPSLERVVVVLERASTATEEVRTGLRSAFERADDHVMPQLLEAVKQGEMFLAEAERLAAPRPDMPAQRAGRARVPLKVSGKGSTPVPVTRGSGHRKTLTRGRRDGPV